jgi:hypothetical protein
MQNIDVAAEWDCTLDQLAEITQRLMAASNALYARRRGSTVIPKVESARANALLIIEHRLKSTWTIGALLPGAA